MGYDPREKTGTLEIKSYKKVNILVNIIDYISSVKFCKIYMP